VCGKFVGEPGAVSRVHEDAEQLRDPKGDGTHPVKGSSDPTSLVCLPHRYEVKFKPRNEVKLREQVAAREKIVGEC
jgi:hypothetical protein